jgi:hypothetical protein
MWRPQGAGSRASSQKIVFVVFDRTVTLPYEHLSREHDRRARNHTGKARSMSYFDGPL